MFVGEFNNGNLYHFDLNDNRTELILEGTLEDKLADVHRESDDTLFGNGFVAIADIEAGPDGYLYILNLHQSGHDCDPKSPDCMRYDASTNGTLFKIHKIN
jgi:hypothetical protein